MACRVFAVAAHPDDIEFGMAGTLFLLKAAGCEIHYMDIANGSCGSLETNAATTATLRLEEAQNAAAHLDATFYPPLCNDLEIFYNKTLLAQLASIMRRAKPDIVLTHALNDYMEDHMNAARLAVTAAFSRGMPNFPVEPAYPHTSQTMTLYHAQPHGNRDQMGRISKPNFLVNIDSVIQQKAAMLAAHRSQKEWLDQSQGMDAYIETMKEISSECASFANKSQYAEGWSKHSHLGFCDADSDPLSDLLNEYMHVLS